ncbi:MAG TPA: F0F1 ATP synthase subunit B [Methylomirabilota bacterium]|nr:F0F1 ATP synthase subunit B [Methylomirabilota bacterium]
MFITSAFAQETAPEGTPVVPLDGEGEAVHTEVGQEEGAHGDVFPPFDPSTFASQLLWLALTFGVLYWTISRIAAPRIASILEVRRDRIAGDLGEAERLRGETDAAVVAYEQSLADARKSAGAIAAETRDQVNRDLDAKRQAIEADLAGKLGEAEARITQIKTKALEEVDAIATETTEAIVSALIGKGSSDEAASAVIAVRRG